MMAARGRVSLDRYPVARVEEPLAAERPEFLPLTPAVAATSSAPPHSPGGLAERLIVASAVAPATRAPATVASAKAAP